MPGAKSEVAVMNACPVLKDTIGNKIDKKGYRNAIQSFVQYRGKIT